MYERQRSVPQRDPFETLVDVLTAVTRYDIALAIVPIAFTVAVVAATVFGIPTWYTLLFAGVVGAAVIVDACYLNPPIEPGQGSETA